MRGCVNESRGGSSDGALRPGNSKALGGGFLFALIGCSMIFARGQSNDDEDGGDGEGDVRASCAGIDDWTMFEALGGGFLLVLNGCPIAFARGQSNGDEDEGDGDEGGARASCVGIDDWTGFE